MLLLQLLLTWVVFEFMPMEPAARAVTFEKDVQPILEKRCTPCHFPGGVMHAKLPFDKSETVVTLGTKLFTRIKNDDEQRVIRAFLASAAPPAAAAQAAAQPAPAARPRAKATTSGGAPARRE